MRHKLFLAGACTALLLAGCSGFHSAQELTQVYTLEPVAPAATQPVAVATAVGNAGSVTVQVLRPLAAPGLDTDRIAVRRGAARLDYYAASRWPAPLPDVLQSRAIATLRASGLFRAVQSEAAAFTPDEVLQIEIRRCQAEYSSADAAVVRVQLVATLGRHSDRSLVASVEAESAVPAAENRQQAVIAAFQQAVDEALGLLVTRLPQSQPPT